MRLAAWDEKPHPLYEHKITARSALALGRSAPAPLDYACKRAMVMHAAGYSEDFGIFVAGWLFWGGKDVQSIGQGRLRQRTRRKAGRMMAAFA